MRCFDAIGLCRRHRGQAALSNWQAIFINLVLRCCASFFQFSTSFVPCSTSLSNRVMYSLPPHSHVHCSLASFRFQLGFMVFWTFTNCSLQASVPQPFHLNGGYYPIRVQVLRELDHESCMFPERFTVYVNFWFKSSGWSPWVSLTHDFIVLTYHLSWLKITKPHFFLFSSLWSW